MLRELLLLRKNWDKLAIIDNERTVAYKELACKAVSLARLISALQPQRAALLLPNNDDYIAALFGAVMSTQAVIPLSGKLTENELEIALLKTDADLLITSRTVGAGFVSGKIVPGTGGTTVRVLYIEEAFSQPVSDDELEESSNRYGGVYDPNSVMLMLFTSGTTSDAKIVMLSENNICSCITDYYEKMDLSLFRDDEIRSFLCVPFTSAYGIFMICAYALRGYTIVLLPDVFTADLLFRVIERHRVTLYEGGTAVLNMLEHSIGRHIPYDISSLRKLSFGGSPTSAETLERLFEAYPRMEFWQGYGMTEASPLITKFRRSVPRNKLGAVGVKAAGMELLISQGGCLTEKPFVQGEIVVKGANVMLGYYKNEEATKTALRGGYLYTGDIGYLDREGCLYICGRVRNIILVRGFTVYAEEVEACIMSGGFASDCFVYGEIDPIGGERVCADIVPLAPDLTAEHVTAYCRTCLAPYKVPREIHFTDGFIVTESGKKVRRR